MDYPWIKLYNTTLNDPRLGALGDSAWRRYQELQLVAGTCDAGGRLLIGGTALTVEELAWQLRVTPRRLLRDLETLLARGLVAHDGEAFWLPGFAATQGRPSTDERERWRIQKQHQRARMAAGGNPCLAAPQPLASPQPPEARADLSAHPSADGSADSSAHEADVRGIDSDREIDLEDEEEEEEGEEEEVREMESESENDLPAEEPPAAPHAWDDESRRIPLPPGNLAAAIWDMPEADYNFRARPPEAQRNGPGRATPAWERSEGDDAGRVTGAPPAQQGRARERRGPPLIAPGAHDPPRPAPHSGPPISQDEAAAIFRREVGLGLDISRRAEVAAAVTDGEAWRRTLEHWMSHHWSPRNITGMLDLYRRGGPAACYTCAPQRKRPIDMLVDELNRQNA